MGEANTHVSARIAMIGPIIGTKRMVSSIVFAGCLCLIPLGTLSSQTNEMSAQRGDQQPRSSNIDQPPDFASQFAEVIPPLEQAPVDIDPALPPTAVDLGTFDPPLEVRPKTSIVRDLGTGVASYYGRRFHGRRTANGERFNMNAMTAAHKTLPFGTRVKVTNQRNGRSVTVRINDRGPFIAGRAIDLSRAAAKRIGMIARGHASVKLDVVAR